MRDFTHHFWWTTINSVYNLHTDIFINRQENSGCHRIPYYKWRDMSRLHALMWPNQSVLYPPPWVLEDSAKILQNVGIPLGIHRNGRSVQFLWIFMEFQGNSMEILEWFLWIPSGIWVEFPLNFHSNSRMIPSGIWMEFPWLLISISVKIEFNINIYKDISNWNPYGWSWNLNSGIKYQYN